MKLKSVMNNIKIIMVLVGVLMLVPTTVFAKDKINVYMFTGDGCAHCIEAKSAFENLKEEYGEYFTLNEYEVWNNEDNATLMEKVKDKLGDDIEGVPYIIIGDNSWEGYTESYLSEIKDKIVEEYNSDNRYDVLKNDKASNDISPNNDSSSNSNSSTSDYSEENGILVFAVILMLVPIIALLVYYYKNIKSAKISTKLRAERNKKFGIMTAVYFITLLLVLCIIGLIDNDNNKYLNAKIKGCPNITLKEGLDNLKSFYNKYNVDFTYKVKSGESESGVARTYLYLNNMETLYDYNVYVPLELNDGVVSFSYVFRNGTVERGIVGGSASIEAALCGNYN